MEVTKRGELKLHRVDVVFEQGFSFMNPLSVRKQIEGQIAWGYSDAMHQAMTSPGRRGCRAQLRHVPDLPHERVSQRGQHRLLEDESVD